MVPALAGERSRVARLHLDRDRVPQPTCVGLERDAELTDATDLGFGQDLLGEELADGCAVARLAKDIEKPAHAMTKRISPFSTLRLHSVLKPLSQCRRTRHGL